MKHQNKQSTTAKTRLVILFVVLVLVAFLLLLLEKRNVINLYSTDARKLSEEKAKTTSSADTAQENFSDGDIREPGNSIGENEGTGVITDNNGFVDENTDTTNPLVSNTGEISLFTPKNEVVLSNGYGVSGTSTLSEVSYRLIDNLSGIIASGSLSVKNGSFSGKISFNTNGNEGRLDIFGVRVDGTEYSNIEIPVRFK